MLKYTTMRNFGIGTTFDRLPEVDKDRIERFNKRPKTKTTI